MLLATTHADRGLVLVTAVFLASAVEMVEALTIVLAVGVTRGWRSALEGVAVALAVLAALVALLGPAARALGAPVGPPLVVGGLLLVFGLQWLRKAVLRAAGLKAKHDEDAIFAEHVAELAAGAPARAGPTPPPSRWPSRACSSRGSRSSSSSSRWARTSHRLGLAGRGRRPPPSWWWRWSG